MCHRVWIMWINNNGIYDTKYNGLYVNYQFIWDTLSNDGCKYNGRWNMNINNGNTEIYGNNGLSLHPTIFG